jgi:hypothetical protein
MKLKIDFDFPASKKPIAIDDQTMLLGSCFTTNIGEKLRENKFNVNINPLGLSFNPLSLHQQLNRIIENRYIENDEIFEKGGFFYHWDFHSDFCENNKIKMLEKLNLNIHQAHEFLKKTNHLILSYGTSYFYQLSINKILVNNCHRFPGNTFTKELGSTNLFIESFSELHKKLSKLNPSLHITTTISPVKHYRDGIIENNHSKSILICYVRDIIAKFKNIEYFPAYEIINEELRDYRFYKENYTHPSDLAIEIIWEKFISNFLGKRSSDFIKDYEIIKKMKSHKIKQVESINHEHFIFKGQKELEKLRTKYPTINFEMENKLFRMI